MALTQATDCLLQIIIVHNSFLVASNNQFWRKKGNLIMSTKYILNEKKKKKSMPLLCVRMNWLHLHCLYNSWNPKVQTEMSFISVTEDIILEKFTWVTKNDERVYQSLETLNILNFPAPLSCLMLKCLKCSERLSSLRQPAVLMWPMWSRFLQILGNS